MVIMERTKTNWETTNHNMKTKFNTITPIQVCTIGSTLNQTREKVDFSNEDVGHNTKKGALLGL